MVLRSTIDVFFYLSISIRERRLILKWVSFGLAIFAALLGVFVGVVEHGGVFGPMDHTGRLGYSVTFLSAAITFIGAWVGLAYSRAALWLYVLAIVGGIFGAGTVWELPGLFIFLTMIVDFIKRRGIE